MYILEDNKLCLSLNKYNTLYQFNNSNVSNYDTDYELIIDIIDKLFNIKYCERIDNNKSKKVILSFDLINDLKYFINNIDNEIINIDNYYNLHKLVKGMHFNKTLSKNILWANCKNMEDANKYYNILRHYGMDIEIKKSLLNFNSIYKINMNSKIMPTHLLNEPNPNVISCFYNNPHEYYSIKYTFLKVMSVIDKSQYGNILSINNKFYNVENIIII